MRYIKYIVLLAFVFSIAGCSKSDDGATKDESQPERTTSSTDTAEPEPNTDFVNDLLEDAYEIKYFDDLTEISADEIEGRPYTCEGYDEKGNWLFICRFDENGRPEDYNPVVWEFDENNRVVSRSKYDIEGNPVLEYSIYGHHREEYEYDENGNRVSESLYGINGEPTITSKYNELHRTEWEYDENGNEISRSFYGIDGEPINDGGGCHRFEYEYDENDCQISRKAYDADGNDLGDEGFLD